MPQRFHQHFYIKFGILFNNMFVISLYNQILKYIVENENIQNNKNKDTISK